MSRAIWRMAQPVALWLLSCTVVISAPMAEKQSKTEFIVPNSPQFAGLFGRDVRLEHLKSDYFGFTEGPIWVNDSQGGYLLFVDAGAARIYRWRPEDESLSVHWERARQRSLAGVTYNWLLPVDQRELEAHYNGRLSVVIMGPAGLALDEKGRVLVTDIAERTVWRLDPGGERTVLASHFGSKRLSGPNDIIVRSDGVVYFTDMPLILRRGAKDPTVEIPRTSLFMLRDGKVSLIAQDPLGAMMNGVALSADEKYLFAGGGPKVVRFEVKADGSAADPRLIVDLTKEHEEGGGIVDGIRSDGLGNIWIGAPRGLRAVTPEGKELGTVVLPKGEYAVNFAFGDLENGFYQSIYITSTASLLRLRGLHLPAH